MERLFEAVLNRPEPTRRIPFRARDPCKSQIAETPAVGTPAAERFYVLPLTANGRTSCRTPDALAFFFTTRPGKKGCASLGKPLNED